MDVKLLLLALVFGRAASSSISLSTLQSFACDEASCNATCATTDGAATVPLRLEFWAPNIAR